MRRWASEDRAESQELYLCYFRLQCFHSFFKDDSIASFKNINW